jgi:hypothetical protein
MKPGVLLLVMVAVAALSGCADPEAERAATAAAESAKANETRAREAAAAKREAERLADLWTYTNSPAGKGRQLSAYLFSAEPVDTDGQGANRVQLVFRDHPAWGRSSYLVLQGGDFNCYSGCTIQVKVDDAAPKPMAGRRPKTDEAIAMFINDEAALWRMTAGAKRITIEFPVRAGGTRAATFDVAGLDRSKMPKWDPSS